ncbi:MULTISPECIES: phosphoglucosamine mutase [unclassified Halorubrum]|uniref:phosphoglucosamine mutase n=1 Tax=unclassified Halorubrum TaxID=2642239 RepID=UPI000B98B9EF|nr:MULTISPECIES: phosphoglucosamine mutase [unclassified Halorubrum]OYR48897.1 phosphoglucosamine mutase [Halorubrum sp. Eb13]OYR50685.1 phosphoglucosamine mutase [Halorubrum sp. Ea1]OYR51852.1 phosphoglucosamine mutase [Halorubrum sp. Ea8]
MELFGSSGIRGVALRYLTPELVLDIAKAAGSVWDADRVAVARDTRTTGELFVNAAASGLAAVGCDVDRLGVVPTPAVGNYCESTGVPAVLVTASHNPPEFNGIKLVGDDGVELSVDVLERVERRVLDDEYDLADWRTAGATTAVDGAVDDYVDQLLDAVDREAIADAGLTVAVDPGHGAASVASPRIYRELGCDVLTVNATPDGHFPGRDSEPIAENLEALSRLVATSEADVGIAHDGDADRAVFVDEDGGFVDGDTSFAAMADACVEPGDSVVSAVNVSQRLVDVCDANDADLELTPIGATNIITRTRELHEAGVNVPVAGEGNGGLFFPPYRLSRDGAYIGARFLELLADAGEPVSDVVAPYADYHFVRRNVEYADAAERDEMLSAARAYVETADAKPNTTDGYRLDYGDAWVLVRPSGTEPKVRIYAESADPDRAEQLATDMLVAVESGR